MVPGLRQRLPVVPDITALADRCGLQYRQPDWLPGLISRYGLTRR
jgi:hypothetical protein